MLIFLFLGSILSAQYCYIDIADAFQLRAEKDKGPIIRDPNFGIDVVSTGIDFPSDMTFLGANDILVLEKNQGTVRRIVNGQMLDDPLLEVNNISNISERGLLGIAAAKKMDKERDNIYYIYLYFTELKEQTRNNNNNNANHESASNRIYRYELAGNHLTNPKLLLSLPAAPSPYHNGGKMLVGPDKNLYASVGDFGLGRKDIEKSSKVQNNEEGSDPDGRAGILRITQDVNEITDGEGILGNEYPLNIYYAYGIRNSFGMDFDPVTSILWDTENGPNYGDEINLVEPGFNSGWNKVHGFWEPEGEERGERQFNPNNLVDFNGKGEYSDPEFVWNYTVGLTAIGFLNSDKFGEEYENDMFVGDFNNGNLYHFDLNEDRTELSLDGDLEDKVADVQQESDNKLFGKGFIAITDIEVSPDGYLYILSLDRSGDDCNPKYPNCIKYNSSIYGTLFKIYPVN